MANSWTPGDLKNCKLENPSLIFSYFLMKSGPIDHPGIHAICLPCMVGLYTSPRQRSAGKADGPLRRGGFLPAQHRSFGDLAAEADRKLFRAVVTDPRHVLSRLLPEVKSTSYNLRPRAHCFVLPTKDTRN